MGESPKKALNFPVAILAIIILVLFVRVLEFVPFLYYSIAPAIVLVIAAAVYLGCRRRDMENPKCKNYKAVIAVLLVVFAIFANHPFRAQKMQNDYEENVVPWCADEGLEPFFVTFDSASEDMRPKYGCIIGKDRFGKNVRVYVGYPFNQSEAEIKLAAMREIYLA